MPPESVEQRPAGLLDGRDMSPIYPDLLRTLKRERLHVEPRALDSGSSQVRRRFAHIWAPADALVALLAPWPTGLLAFWLAAPVGHVLFSAAPSAYLPEGMVWHGATLPGLARISPADLLDEPRPALETMAHLVDHLLGAQGRWLSDGAGATPALGALAERLQALVRLGYGPGDPHAYFAWAFAGYWLDRRALNIADPNVERLLHTTLCSDAFWA